jgi:D-arabinose 1-dehydrogenase-like Zn-dependent alcohol dehydrogenase
VYVTSSSDEKLERARQMGAQGGANYSRHGWADSLAVADFDMVLDSSGYEVNKLISLAKRGGSIVNIGMTKADTTTISIPLLFSRQVSLLGSTLGSPREFQAMLSLVSQAQIVPAIERILPLALIQYAFALQQRKERFGKIIITIS